MKLFQLLRTPLFYTFCITLLVITSCVNEKIEYNLLENSGIKIEGDCITFDIVLDKEIFSKGNRIVDWNNHSGQDQIYDESIENYIDTQNKLKIFFFTQYGDFIFGGKEIYIFENSKDNSEVSWKIVLPLNMVLDFEGYTYDAEKIKSYLRKNKFKIAVLANWPNESELLWGWKNSVLNPEAEEIKNINDLHHIYDDPVYKKCPVSYGFAMKESTYMGQPYDWVKMRDVESGWKNGNTPSESFHTKTEANDWIRKYWDPTITKNEGHQIYRHYQYLWYLWDFDAAYNSSEENYSRYCNRNRWPLSMQSEIPANKWGKEWFERNGKSIKAWLKEEDFRNNWKEDNNSGSQSVLKYIAGDNCKLTTIKQTGVGELTGITISKGSIDQGAFSFLAQASGDVIIRCSSSSEKEEGELVIKVGEKELVTRIEGTDAREISLNEICIESIPEDIIIYCNKGNIVVYSMEYICGGYLYYTDQEGIMPNENNPIPMYGVQEFEPMLTWSYGTIYDISQEQNTYIWLLRSIAKVEVYVPQRFGKISHIYMRNFNTAGRCEPIDVETDTKKLWDHVHNSKDKNLLEIKRLMNYKQAYNSSIKNESEYAFWLKWFYGSWANTYWKNSRRLIDDIWEVDNSKKSGWDFNLNTFEESNYPKIFNAYITNSDFAHFTYGGEYSAEGEIFDKYVIYVPEKYLDNPSIVGDRSSKPQVAHIEYRFVEKESSEDNYYHNSQTNLDDNDCYRIYFTNYGSSSGLDESLYPVNTEIKSVRKNEFDEYEKSESINKHWPIIRNHIYQFFLGGKGPEIHEINIKIKDWGYDSNNNKEVAW